MGILNEIGKQNKSGIDPKRVLEDIKKWKDGIRANALMIESALITLDAYFEEEK